VTLDIAVPPEATVAQDQDEAITADMIDLAAVVDAIMTVTVIMIVTVTVIVTATGESAEVETVEVISIDRKTLDGEDEGGEVQEGGLPVNGNRDNSTFTTAYIMHVILSDFNFDFLCYPTPFSIFSSLS